MLVFQLNLSYSNILNNLNLYEKEVEREEERELLGVYRCNTMKEYEMLCNEYNMMSIAKEECNTNNMNKRWNKGKEEVQKNMNRMMKVEFIH